MVKFTHGINQVLVLFLCCLFFGCSAVSTDTSSSSSGTTSSDSDSTSTTSGTTTSSSDDGEYKIQAIYVVPSGSTDNAYDTDGTIIASIGILNTWFSTQTGGSTLRFATNDSGTIKVERILLNRTDAAMKASGDLRVQLEIEVAAAGFNDVKTYYIIYYDSQASDAKCEGEAILRPGIGNIGYIQLCDLDFFESNTIAESPQTSNFEYVVIHEIFHLLGGAPSCAKNYDSVDDKGHTTDNLEMMYNSSADPENWDPQFLDQNNDDYFGHSNPDCRDLADSAFLSPEPTAKDVPAGTPNDNVLLSASDKTSCDQESSLSSISGVTDNRILFTNATDSDLKLIWIDTNGTRQFQETISAKSRSQWSSFVGQYWMLADSSDNCVAIYELQAGDHMLTIN
ncbi:hypothetical protein BVY03_00730 [bacterium K02(2017)]|nr:hypothetical protein BVY03_00730 [bacterium K02(2017)]